MNKKTKIVIKSGNLSSECKILLKKDYILTQKIPTKNNNDFSWDSKHSL